MPEESGVPTYDVRFSEAAEADTDTLMLRQYARSPETAHRWYQGLLATIQTLSQLPNRCPLAPENGRFDRPVRQLLYRQGQTVYRILYIVFEADGDEPAFVRIMRVLYGAQPWDQPQANDEEL